MKIQVLLLVVFVSATSAMRKRRPAAPTVAPVTEVVASLKTLINTVEKLTETIEGSTSRLVSAMKGGSGTDERITGLDNLYGTMAEGDPSKFSTGSLLSLLGGGGNLDLPSRLSSFSDGMRESGRNDSAEPPSFTDVQDPDYTDDDWRK